MYAGATTNIAGDDDGGGSMISALPVLASTMVEAVIAAVTQLQPQPDGHSVSVSNHCAKCTV